MMGLSWTGFPDAEENDEAEDRGGQRVGDEEDQVVVTSDQSREKRSNHCAQVDRPVVVSIGARPRFRWHQVCNCRANGGPVKIRKESDDQGGDRNESKIACQAECDHKDGCDKETHQHHRMAAKRVGQFAACELRDERTCTEEEDHRKPYLHIKGPFALAHHGLSCAIFTDAINVHLRGADHKVNMGETGVPACGIELLIS